MARYTLWVDVEVTMSTFISIEAPDLETATERLDDREIAEDLLEQIHADGRTLEECITSKRVWKHEIA